MWNAAHSQALWRAPWKLINDLYFPFLSIPTSYLWQHMLITKMQDLKPEVYKYQVYLNKLELI